MEAAAQILAPVIGHKAPAETRVVVAMSGGVDSSVTAALLAEAGYDVVGVTLQLYDHGAATASRKGACCAGQDIHDARRVADRLGIPHYVLDYESRFRSAVIDEFADAYLRGETPIPCVRCNQTVKFADLLSTARDLGADAMATGHYVRRVVGRDGAELHRAADMDRDQSYFLFATTRRQLDFLRFPLGDLPKRETRSLAARFALPVAAKPDSQDICFVPNGRYADVVRKLRPQASGGGEIVHVDGRVLGRHDGIVGYTIGQRRGIGVGGVDGDASAPLYVVRLEPQTRRVVVGPRAALARDRVTLAAINWLGDGDGPVDGQRVRVRLRSTTPPVPARMDCAEGAPVRVRLDAPQFGVSPGQACVFYDAEDGGRVLGGGWIVGADCVAATGMPVD
ncbi:MAG: tRNA 2-thiouridine(34) synthase MnmA [Alphaproteobacteria bacterium]